VVERTDHFAAMRASPEPAPSEPPEGAPVVTPYLIEWLEKQFPSSTPVRASSLNDAIAGVTGLAQWHGEQRVITYLRTLVKGA
jgi:hypothetical protein